MPFLRKKKETAEEAAAKAGGGGMGKMMNTLTGGDTIAAIKSVIFPNTDEKKEQGFVKRVEDLPQIVKSDLCLKLGFFCLVLFLIIGIYHVASVTKTSDVKTKRRIVVSMDGDPSDYLALEYLLQRQDAVVEMIVLNGNGWSSSLGAFTNSMDNFFDSRQKVVTPDGVFGGAKPEPKPPVFYGASFASAAGNTNCTYRRVIDPVVLLGHDAAWNTPNVMTDASASGDAEGDTVASSIALYAAPLYNLLQASSSRSVDFIVLGPLTDLAWYFEAHPSHGRYVRSMQVDGGTFKSGNMGNYFPANEKSEWNLFFDPAAAKYLLERTQVTAPVTKKKRLSNFPLTLLPLDASRLCSSIDADLYKAILADGNNPWLKSLMNNYVLAREISSTSWPLSNPLYAAAMTVDPQSVPGQAQTLAIQVGDPKAPKSTVSKTNTMLETAGSLSRATGSASIQETTVRVHYECSRVLAHLKAVAAL